MQNIPWDNIESMGQRTMLYRDIFSVSFILQRFCNFKKRDVNANGELNPRETHICPYCWQRNDDPLSYKNAATHIPDFFSKETYFLVLDEIKKQARENGFNSFHFSFSGGEPTANAFLLDLLEKYNNDEKANYQSIHLTTNLSPSIKWWSKFAENTRTLQRASITASWHRGAIARAKNPETYIKEWADKLEYLQTQDIQVTINIVMVPQLWNILWEEAEYFQSRNINVTLKPQSNDAASMLVDGYTNEMLDKLQTGMIQTDFVTNKAVISRQLAKNEDKWLNHLAKQKNKSMQLELKDYDGKYWYVDQAERLNSYGFNKFQGWDCNAGFQNIAIQRDIIKRAHSCLDEPIGYIREGEVKLNLLKKSQMCITPSCVSSADSKIPKSR